MSECAGRKLKRDMGKALAAAGRERGKKLESTEQEVDILERAAQTADRAAHLREGARGRPPVNRRARLCWYRYRVSCGWVIGRW